VTGLGRDDLIAIAVRVDRLCGNGDGQSGNCDDQTGRQELEHTFHAIPPTCNAGQIPLPRESSPGVLLQPAQNYKLSLQLGSTLVLS
jgi:hypothetical protein